jgi:DNA uptake protein ComE-like DNA-binding protein
MKPSLKSSAGASRQILADGSVLIIVLLVSLGLVSVTLLFAHSMVMSLRGSDNDLAGQQAEQAIEGAARYAQLLMTNVEKPGTFPDVTAYDSEELPVGEASVWFIGQNPLPDTDTVPVFSLVDEAGKLNLNKATKELLEALPGMTVELAAAIIDWRDSDADVTQNGAESETYLRKQPAYECKNADFETIEELALLNGADPLVLYGEDANLNGVLDPNEDDGDKSAPPDNSDGKLDPGILAYVTVFSREPNTQSDGTTPRVLVTNPNTAVRDLLQNTFGESRAEAIMDRLGTAGNRFNSTLQFFVSSGMTADEFAQISDSITTSTEPFVTGLINVNTASEAVLATIPGNSR